MEDSRKHNQSKGLFYLQKNIKDVYPEFFQILSQRQNELLGRAQDARHLLDEQILTDPGDVADMSVADTSADYFLTLANNQKRELNEIQSALDRLHQGIYGVCEACTDPIAIGRLKKLPYARLCVECQTALEHQRKAS